MYVCTPPKSYRRQRPLYIAPENDLTSEVQAFFAPPDGAVAVAHDFTFGADKIAAIDRVSGYTN